MRDFKQIIAPLENNFSNKSDLQALMPAISDKSSLASMADSEYLSKMELRIFQAGMRHSVVSERWHHFESQFWGFDPNKCMLIGDELLEKFMQNKNLIRHWTKMKTIPVNSAAILSYKQTYEGFGDFIAKWPSTDLVGLWRHIGKSFSRMGGNSSAYFLRMVGYDTFILTEDVVVALNREAIVDKHPTSQKDLKLVQCAFNSWHDQTGLPYAHLSKLLALSVGI